MPSKVPERGPLTEYNSVNNGATRLSSKLSLTGTCPAPVFNVYAPKSSAAVSLKSYLTKKVTPAEAPDPTTSAKARGKTRTASKTQQANDSTNNELGRSTGLLTQRTTQPKTLRDLEPEPKAQRTYRLSHGALGISTTTTGRQPRLEPKGGDENKPTAKTLSITIPDLAPTLVQSAKFLDLKCLTARNLQTEPPEDPAVPLQPASSIAIPNHEPAKCSLKSNGVVKGYGANTNQGLVR